MNIDDLFNLVNKIYTLNDEGIERGSSLEEVNAVMEEEFGASAESGFYKTLEEFHKDWDLAERMCNLYEHIIAGSKQ